MRGTGTASSRIILAVPVGFVAFIALITQAHAQSSLGIGAAEPMITPTGPFPVLMQWINVHQQEFYRSLTKVLAAMRHDPGKAWWLIGISFIYGIFHAAGPGHGKAVISSYMLANEIALRRGVILSFLSAAIQAVMAIVLITLAFLVLRGTSWSVTDTTWAVEILSYAMVVGFGLWLLWRKLGSLWRSRRRKAPAMASLSAAHVHGTAHAHHGHHHTVHHRFDEGHADHHNHHHARGHGDGEVCDICGHSHAPDPALLGGERFDWRTAWTAVTAVGLRPCSGALIVLTFAFLNGIYAGGVASVLAMALGTAITVSLLATLAVTAKNVAVRVSGGGRIGGYVTSTFEIGGALLVILFGLALLTASLHGLPLPS
jgi:ABC-type nickel/cobalt efflux system permease component RcnA